MAPSEPFVLLATLGDPASAELCAARLRAEGIPSQLRGESLGPYRLTVGDMARTELWVPASRRAEAAEILAESGDDPGGESPEPVAAPALGLPQRRALPPWPVVVATALLGAAVLWALLRLLA